MGFNKLALALLIAASIVVSPYEINGTYCNIQAEEINSQHEINKVLVLANTSRRYYAESTSTTLIDGVYSESQEQIWTDVQSGRTYTKQSSHGKTSHHYINGGELITYNEGEKTYQKMLTKPSPQNSLLKAYEQGELLFVEDVKVNSWDTMHFIRKGKSTNLQHIWLDKKTGIVVKLLLVSESSFWSTTFTKIDSNSIFSDKKFIFIVPPHVKVETISPEEIKID